MAQPFSLRYVLVDGQGNFGSVDGDPPAAYRYTEARLSRIAHTLLEDIDKETVDFKSNFDDSTEEPEVLPARVPNMLINGSSGIAVGMATNIPPHNLNEIVSATIALVQNPNLTLAEVLKLAPGPDFPTGGLLLGQSGIVDYYNRGRGSLKVRAKVATEDIGRDREALIVTELPYQVNKARLIADIAAMVEREAHRRHQRHSRRKRSRRHAYRHRVEARRNSRSGAEQSVQAHADADRTSASSCCRSSMASRASSASSIASGSSSITASMSCAGVRTSSYARPANASICCSASRRRSIISIWSSS